MKKKMFVRILIVTFAATAIIVVTQISRNSQCGADSNVVSMNMGDSHNMTGTSMNSGKSISTNGSVPESLSSYGCMGCHTIKGNKNDGMGPDLSHIGSQRSLHWIEIQIVNPAKHFKRGSQVTMNGKSFKAIMPSFKYMPRSQVRAIAKYLKSLM